MLSLRPINISLIAHWLLDYSKKSKDYTFPVKGDEILGIYLNEKLIGYFIGHTEGNDLWIRQGYLEREYQFSDIPKLAVNHFCDLAKLVGFNEVYCMSRRPYRSYKKLMDLLNFKTEYVVYKRQI